MNITLEYGIMERSDDWKGDSEKKERNNRGI